MRRAYVLAAAIVVMGAAAACTSDHSTTVTKPTATTPTTGTTAKTSTSPSSPSPQCDRPHASGQFDQSFTFDGARRTYVLYVPARYDGTRAVPVVFEFHGFGSNAHQQVRYGNFEPLADRDGFLIVAPDGQGEGSARHFDYTTDVRMVGALLDRIEQTFCVDTQRVYSTGMSNGGAMTVVLACTMANRFAAFGPVAALGYHEGCGGNRAVPIVGFAGTADPVVPFNGGRVNCCGGAEVQPAPASMAGWSTHDKCAQPPDETRVGTDVTKRTWTGCAPGGDVTFYAVNGGGHTWPGSAVHVDRLGKTTTSIDATATIWGFFKAHSLTR
jgi:polyhydroxybutyrate depolymerase